MIRLLVIDDEDIIREAFARVFEPLKDRFTVATAGTGEQGLAMLEAEPFDIVFTDLRMPGIDGLEVIRRGKQVRRSTDFAMMTGYASVDSAVDSMKLGGLDYIEKPFSQDELLAFVEKILKVREARIRQREERRGFERFSVSMRVQHVILMVTFFLLGFTGVPLFFPDIFKGVFFFEDSSYLRGLMHRFAAVGLILLSLWHMGYLMFREEGHRNLKAFLPRLPRDLVDAWHDVLWQLGLRKERPRVGKYNWIEKFEYFGVVWGTFIMVLTGAILWFSEFVLQFAPLWVIDVAKVIHRYEAILAIATIAVWHMYCVHWKPGVFPGSRTWITGRISRHEMLEEHPLEYEAVTGRAAVSHPAGEEAR